MKKFLLGCCLITLLAFILVGCNNNEVPSNPVDTSNEISATPIILEELYQQFELVYDNCGASASREDEQITAELSALSKKAEGDEKEWPNDYETLYKAWRTSTIDERAATVKAEYEQIIAERTLYVQGIEGLWETTPGLVYADYILGQDEKPNMLLLTWLGSDTDKGHEIRVELYRDEKGHASEYFKKDFSFIAIDANISLTECEGKPFLSVDYRDGGSGGEYVRNEFYAIDQTGNESVDILAYDCTRDYDSYDEEYYFLQDDGVRIETTPEEYTAHLGGYKLRKKLLNLGFLGTDPTVQDIGILLKKEVLPEPQIEVNGEMLNLEVAPYGYSGELMVPLRDVLEAMNVAVYANFDVSVILASTRNDTLVIANKDFSTSEKGIEGQGGGYNGYKYSLNGGADASIVLQSSNGKMCGPIQTIASQFGAQTEWDSSAKTLRITSSISADNQLSQDELKAMADFIFDKAVKVAEQNGYSLYSMTTLDYDHYDENGNYAPITRGGLTFKNGKAIWYFFVLGGEYYDNGLTGPYGGASWNVFGAEAMSDGTFVLHSDVEIWEGAGAY